MTISRGNSTWFHELRTIFASGAFSQCRIYSRYIALQIAAIEAGKLAK